jgi:putative membrane protein
MDYHSDWIYIIRSFFKSKTLRALVPGLLTMCSYTAVLVYANNNWLANPLKISTFIFSLVGIVLGLLLVFRTNTAYERWWEGRKTIGTMLNQTRNMAIKFNAFLPMEAMEERRILAHILINYSYALKEHLRANIMLQELLPMPEEYEVRIRKTDHLPNMIASFMMEKVIEYHQKKIFSDTQLFALFGQLDFFTDVTGICERIKRTPIPWAYKVHLIKFIFLFIMLLPLGLIQDMGYWSVGVVAVIFYAFVGLDFIAGEIEDPFGTDDNDLPTDALSFIIERNVYELMHLGRPR